MEKLYEIKLKYTPPIGGEHQVSVAGTFSNWKKLEMVAESGSYSITLRLSAGRYAYKFIVNGKWMNDDNADYFDNDQMGGSNSILVVKEQFEPLHIVQLVFDAAKRKPEKVEVTGTFCNWQTGKIELIARSEGVFQTHLLLSKGEYQYKFILDGKLWLIDENNPHKISDNRGGYNSVLKVDEGNEIYDGSQPEIFTYDLCNYDFPRAENIGNGLQRFSCRAYLNNLDKVLLDLNDEKYEMLKYFSDGRFDYFSLIQENSQEKNKFRFILQKEEKEKVLQHSDFYLKFHKSDLEWIQKGAIYQIFCDRFCNGDESLNPDFKESYYDSKQNYLNSAARKNMYHFEPNWQNYQLLENDLKRHHTFYGGDLPGVMQKLDYLKVLGITCIYFNPLVKAASNHKYDTIDYKQIDPHFGSNEFFKKFVHECHNAGISVILDFAFNHVGTCFFAFQDCLKKGKNSKYFSWFDWYNWPLPKEIDDDFEALEYYQCWWGHANLPDLNFDLKRLHPEENYIADSKDAEINEPLVKYLLQVAEFWLQEMDIDGFRLDVPNEVPFWFWQKFREKVKAIKPQAYLVGEIWHNASQWIGDYFDAVMNYSFFREPVLQFFALQNWTQQRFLNEIMQGIHQYGFDNLSLMMNLISSHDTYRFLEACKGNLANFKLALIFQFCWIGIPHIYYGDEIGMLGGNDPDNRRPMNWHYSDDKTSIEIHDFVQKLNEIRSSSKALVYGDIRIKQLSKNIICLERWLPNEKYLILINYTSRQQTVTWENKTEVIDLITEKLVKVNSNKLIIEPESGMIVKQEQ